MAENTNNTNENWQKQLSPMDEIFIPQDLDDNVSNEDLVSYKTCKLKFWRTVPENFRLVKINRITQKITFNNKFGWIPVPPIFVKTILVPAPILDGKREYKNVDCLSKDKIEISVDLTIIMHISDPAKYKRKGATQLSQLDSIINRLLRVYVARKNFDNLVEEECDLTKFDINKAFDAFEQECGIKITRVTFEKVRLPERLKKLYNDAAEEEQKRKAQAVRLKAEQEKAEADAKRMKILADAEAEKIKVIENAKAEAWLNQKKSFVAYLISQNIPVETIAEQLKIKIASEGNAFVTIGDANSNNTAANIAAGLNAANQYNQKNNPVSQTTISNSERLINDINFLASNGEISQETYLQTIEMLKNPTTKATIDNCSEVVYNNFIKKLIEHQRNNNQSEEYSESETKPRGRR